jgi:hypothetical protein
VGKDDKNTTTNIDIVEDEVNSEDFVFKKV